MNLVHGFEHKSPVYFFTVFVIGLLVGLYVKSWVTDGTDRRDR